MLAGCRCNVRNIFGVIRERRLPWLKDAATARKLASDGVWRGLFSKAQREALGRLAAFMGEQQEEEEVRGRQGCMHTCISAGTAVRRSVNVVLLLSL